MLGIFDAITKEKSLKNRIADALTTECDVLDVEARLEGVAGREEGGYGYMGLGEDLQIANAYTKSQTWPAGLVYFNVDVDVLFLTSFSRLRRGISKVHDFFLREREKRKSHLCGTRVSLYNGSSLRRLETWIPQMQRTSEHSTHSTQIKLGAEREIL